MDHSLSLMAIKQGVVSSYYFSAVHGYRWLTSHCALCCSSSTNGLGRRYFWQICRKTSFEKTFWPKKKLLQMSIFFLNHTSLNVQQIRCMLEKVIGITWLKQPTLHVLGNWQISRTPCFREHKQPICLPVIQTNRLSQSTSGTRLVWCFQFTVIFCIIQSHSRLHESP